MAHKFSYKLVLTAVLACFGSVIAQTPETGVKPSVITGDVSIIDASKIVVTTKEGTVQANLTDKTEFKRVSATNPSLKSAVAASASDIGVGDRVAITGVLAVDKRSLPARTVYLMTKSDISERHAKEAALWKTRGIDGRVSAVNPAVNQITVEIRGMAGSTTTTVITPKESAVFKRYAPDSVKFDEARTSSLAEVKVGDMVRALGDKSADGTSFAAEQVVSGAFQTVAGTVKSVDMAKNEVVVTNLQTKKDVTISFAGATVLKKFPAEMAERMAGAQSGGARPPGGGTPAAQPTGAPGGAQPGPARGGFAGRAGGIDDMLDRFPNITAADLKAGDMIAVSSSKGDDPTRINAIKLLAGVEPFIRMAQAAGGRTGARGQAVDGGFSIPGLDGIGFP